MVVAGPTSLAKTPSPWPSPTEEGTGGRAVKLALDDLPAAIEHQGDVLAVVDEVLRRAVVGLFTIRPKAS